MSSNAHAHDDHGHGHGGADHVPHVLPLGVYFKTYGALLLLTAITVGASYLQVSDTLNLVMALGIATMKASIVALVFMHLYWDQKFFAIIFTSSILFLAIFLAFTMFDTNARGVADPYEAERPADYKTPFTSGTKSEQQMKQKGEEWEKSFDELKKQHPRDFPAEAPKAAPAPAPAPAGAAPAPGAAPAAPAPGAAPAAPAPGAAPAAPAAPAPAAPAPAHQ